MSAWASKQKPSTPGASSCKATESASRKKWGGRKGAGPFTSVTPPETRWNWSRLACGDCRVGGELCRTRSTRPAGLRHDQQTQFQPEEATVACAERRRGE